MNGMEKRNRSLGQVSSHIDLRLNAFIMHPLFIAPKSQETYTLIHPF